METFARRNTDQDIGLEIEHEFPLNKLQTTPRAEDAKKGKLPSRLRSDETILNISVDEEHTPLRIGIEPISELMLSPIEVDIDENTETGGSRVDRETRLNLRANETTPINFRVYLQSDQEGDLLTSYEFYCPPVNLLRWAKIILERRFDAGTFSEINQYYGSESKIEVVSDFLWDIISYVSPNQFLRILNTCAEELLEVREQVETVLQPETAATFLPGGDNENKLKIWSWPKLRQFCTTSEQLEYVPSHDEREIISAAVNQATERLGSQVDTEFSRLWSLDEALEIAERYPHVLDRVSFMSLTSKCAIEERYSKIRALTETWVASETVNDVEEAISDAEERRTERAWREAFATAVESGTRQQLEHTLANLFYQYGFDDDTPRFHRPAVFRTAAQAFESSGNAPLARSAQFWEAYHRGRYALDCNSLDKAVNDFSQAHRLSLEHIQKTGNSKGVKFGDTWRWLAKAEKERLQSQGKYTAARKYLDKRLQLIKSFEDFEDSETQERCRAYVEALNEEAVGDEYLHAEEYEKATEAYGNAIGVLSQADTEFESEIQYLKNRRLAIRGSLLEAEGEYNGAIKRYDEIASISGRVAPFLQRQRARKHICQAKLALLNRQPEEARSDLSKIEYGGQLVSTEIEQLEQIADLLDDYQHGGVTSLNELTSALKEGVVSQRDSRQDDFGYEKDYRTSYMYLITAQRLQAEIEDDDLSDALIDFSLKDVLQPSSVGELIDSNGIGGTERDESWKNEIPDFVTRQIQTATRDAVKKRSSENYANLVETLTGHLEEALEVFVAFHARREYDEEWEQRIAGGSGVSLRDLRDFLDRDIFTSGEVGAEVKTLLDERRFNDIVLDDDEGTIIDIRDDLAHNNVSWVSEKEYERVLDTIRSLLSTIAAEMPTLGVVRGEKKHGAYLVRLLTTHHQDTVEIRTGASLNGGEVYLFSENLRPDERICDVEENDIARLDAEDIRESIRKYSTVNIE
jgi:tetratricopeptide (TPR) repeat protein